MKNSKKRAAFCNKNVFAKIEEAKKNLYELRGNERMQSEDPNSVFLF